MSGATPPICLQLSPTPWGLSGLGHPELVVVSVDQGTASGVLNYLGQQIRAGANLIAGQLVTFDEWPHRVTVEDLANPGEILLAAYQLTYDIDGRFPWDVGSATTRPSSRAQGRGEHE